MGGGGGGGGVVGVGLEVLALFQIREGEHTCPTPHLHTRSPAAVDPPLPSQKKEGHPDSNIKLACLRKLIDSHNLKV